eukprot:TRINITY_DN1218_c0_g1_i1.p1 TRINITY_DN1218_c0_g1~~TRINITY_DN1218_c0_g1_i1.p1  ORF type:complete len:748 (+),score=225.20 TRINITY_DN1218_c0_g1_i1:206-2245(+)
MSGQTAQEAARRFLEETRNSGGSKREQSVMQYHSLEKRTAVLEQTVAQLQSVVSMLTQNGMDVQLQNARQVVSGLLRENEKLKSQLFKVTKQQKHSSTGPSVAPPNYPRYQSTSVKSSGGTRRRAHASPTFGDSSSSTPKSTTPPAQNHTTSNQPQEPALTPQLNVEYPEGYNPMARRYSISSESFSPENFVDEIATLPPKSAEENARISQAVMKNVVFKNLDKEQMTEVVNTMYTEKVEPGKNVVVEGSFLEENEMYVIESGELDVYYGDEVVARLKAGDVFGEIALMYTCPRTATVKAVTECSLWVLNRVTFRRVLMQDSLRRRTLYQSFLSRVPILSGLYPYECAKIADSLVPMYFKAGDVVIQQGDRNADLFYIVEIGKAVATKIDENGSGVSEFSLEYGPGGYFGELVLLYDSPRAATVTAVTDLKTLTITREHFAQLLAPIQEILKRNKENYKTYAQLKSSNRTSKTSKLAKTIPVAPFTALEGKLSQILVHLQGYKKALFENSVTLHLDQEDLLQLFSFLPEFTSVHAGVTAALKEWTQGDDLPYIANEELLALYTDYNKQLPSRHALVERVMDSVMAKAFLEGCDKLTGGSLMSFLTFLSTYPKTLQELIEQYVSTGASATPLLPVQEGEATDSSKEDTKDDDETDSPSPSPSTTTTLAFVEKLKGLVKGE